MPIPSEFASKSEYLAALAADPSSRDSSELAERAWDEHVQRSAGEPSKICARTFDFVRAEINMADGSFPMVLATEGEASDGDILSIPGAEFSERTPLQLAHSGNPLHTLGSITSFRRDLQSTPRKLKATGQIEMTGPEGPSVAVRSDIAHMILQGHIHSVSVRWDPIEWKRRVNLPSDHPHFVDEEREKDPRKRYGLFFAKWRVLEGSIVAVPADQAAIIGRARETQGEVARYWTDLARKMEPKVVDVVDAAVDAYQKALDEAVRLGVSVEDLASRLQKAQPASELAEILRHLRALEERLDRLDEGGGPGREKAKRSGEPSTPTSVRALLEEFLAKQRRSSEEIRDEVRGLLAERVGRIQ